MTQERTLRKDAEQRRQIILEKAAALFAEYGVEHVSMRQIAREAGVGQGTLYRSYTNKGELCWDLIGESCIRNHEKMNNYLSKNTQIPLREQLETVLTYHLDSLETHSSILAVIQTDIASGEQQSSPIYSEHYEAIHSVILKVLEAVAATNQGVVLDPIFMADALMATMQPSVYIFLKEHRKYSPTDIRQRILNVYVDPLFPR
ncbi:TetR/AcrR family transcriptional regulator [Paenibacillus sp. R14(2021)]|uniref:TetR/AcrR family transcriptional regulator n=1 Tax=Paenibacillus sp. R14(2021) TaxID=2859228 RepID=UPI001C612222|nr:TetR/AcrR family transcriptional regulator [Paenibacillus sp. R14(2021)]